MHLLRFVFFAVSLDVQWLRSQLAEIDMTLLSSAPKLRIGLRLPLQRSARGHVGPSSDCPETSQRHTRPHTRLRTPLGPVWPIWGFWGFWGVKVSEPYRHILTVFNFFFFRLVSDTRVFPIDLFTPPKTPKTPNGFFLRGKSLKLTESAGGPRSQKRCHSF